MTHHMRFALSDVKFAGQPLPGATVDWWKDDSGQVRWIARVVMGDAVIPDEGELTGLARDKTAVSGKVRVADRQAEPGGRRQKLVEFHGSGELLGLNGPTS